MTETKTWVEKTLGILDEKKAEHLVAYDVRPQGIFTDWVVLATATSDTHIQALVGYLTESLGEAGRNPRATGRRDQLARWVALDYGDFVVHLFLSEFRARYHLEGLYQKCANITK